MIVGGGEAGAMIIKEFQNSSYLNQKICCVIDDNPAKQGKYLRGIKIMGGREDICRLVQELKIEEIIVAMPSAPAVEVREILNICKETGCDMRVLPGLYQMIKGEVSISKLRKVEIEDLLGREPIRFSWMRLWAMWPARWSWSQAEAAPSEASSAGRWRPTSPSS